MIRQIAIVPVDARPVTCELPADTIRIAGWNAVTPPKQMLGFLKQNGDIKGIHAWLKEIAEETDGFVLSMDMLHYGGLVPSRINEDSIETIQKRTEILNFLKERFPEKPIMVFSSTMRISDSYVNEEEKLYWSEYGKELFAYSYHRHRYEKTGSLESKAYMEKNAAVIPESVLKDYTNTRQRNAFMNQFLIEYAENGIIDILVFPQDDTADYGMNIREQEFLQSEILKRRLFDRVFIYPGADEVACVLSARMVCLLEDIKPPTYYPFFSGEKGAQQNALYEDRPLIESVKGQVYALGGFIQDTTQADIRLAVNVPGKKQGEIALQNQLNEVNTADRNIGEWLLRLEHYLQDDKPLAVADLAYANGADASMVLPLVSKIDVSRLAGFAAWNTAGNTIGTVVAQSAMVYIHKLRRNLEPETFNRCLAAQLILRFLDDFVYQSVVRQDIRSKFNEKDLSEDELLLVVREVFEERANEFLQEQGFARILERWNIRINEIDLPWKRTFEIGIHLTLDHK